MPEALLQTALSRIGVPVASTLIGLFVLLACATVAGRVLSKGKGGELNARILTWWLIVGVMAAALLFGPLATVLLFGLISFLALKEYLSMIPTRRADRATLLWVYLAIPIQYLWVGQAWYGMFIIFIPVYMMLLLPAVMVIRGETTGFLKAAGTLHWGLMATVFAISHAAYLLVGLAPDAPPTGAGLFVFLLVVTAANDVFQYVAGKMFGRRKIAPTVSPNKTLEGFTGGVIGSVLLAVVLAPGLTPFSLPAAAGIGAVLALGGFLGDLTISAVKRDIGIKDTGATLPGHGGILDRIDSLTFTAPLFLHITRYFYL